MTAVIGYLVVATVAVVLSFVVAGPRHTIQRDPTFELEDVSARMVGVMSALAGFAVTGIVFLVTQSRNVPDATGISFTTVLAMFVVAYMGYFSGSLLFANVSHRAEDAPFDLAAAQYAGASIMQFSVFIGWLALRPLFQTFGLTAIADLVGWLLIGAVLVGYGPLASALFRTGYASGRSTLLLAAFAIAGTLLYAAAVAIAPGLRADGATLALTVTAFLIGIPAYLAISALPIAARDTRLAPILAERGHLGDRRVGAGGDGDDRLPAAGGPRPHLTKEEPRVVGPGVQGKAVSVAERSLAGRAGGVSGWQVSGTGSAAAVAAPSAWRVAPDGRRRGRRPSGSS